jgi:predicted sulfurtransferase
MRDRPERHYTLAEYFAIEQDSEIKHEYYDGEIFAMAGRRSVTIESSATCWRSCTRNCGTRNAKRSEAICASTRPRDSTPILT